METYTETQNFNNIANTRTDFCSRREIELSNCECSATEWRFATSSYFFQMDSKNFIRVKKKECEFITMESD